MMARPARRAGPSTWQDLEIESAFDSESTFCRALAGQRSARGRCCARAGQKPDWMENCPGWENSSSLGRAVQRTARPASVDDDIWRERRPPALWRVHSQDLRAKISAASSAVALGGPCAVTTGDDTRIRDDAL